MEKVLAPACPSCGSVCSHPLMWTDDKGEFHPPSDEQIQKADNKWECTNAAEYTMYCGACDFKYWVPERRNCPDCGGDGMKMLGVMGCGKTDIVADLKLWAELKQAWRRREKMTELKNATWEAQGIIEFADRAIDAGDLAEEGFVPKDALNRKGTLTITVTFEPDGEL